MRITVHNGMYDDAPAVDVEVQPHHRAGDIAAYAAELQEADGVWTLFRNGQPLRDGERIGRVFGNERMVIA